MMHEESGCQLGKRTLWEHFRANFLWLPSLGLGLDISRMNFSPGFMESMAGRILQAFEAMQALEKGAIANPDEKRMVGHYWLRNPALAPKLEITAEIEAALSDIKSFAHSVHSGRIMPPGGGRYQHLLLIGIGGSALGPQFVAQALGSTHDLMDCYYFDNSDPDGMQQVLASIPDLSRTLCIVISKSGGTKETRNGMLVAQQAWLGCGLDFSKSFVAITAKDSELNRLADREKWLAVFPMWDWVGGRTSELSTVGLLPAALQGLDIDALLKGAREMDDVTRRLDYLKNPAALLALMWHWAGGGRGERAMVVLPYNDRLVLFSRYLQQLVMESLGKEKDLAGNVVHQGLMVFGNKGSTDQHAYVQQLRDGPDNFFVVFIEVLKDCSPKAMTDAFKHSLPAGFAAAEIEVEPGITSGDYLSGFYQGTRQALHEKGRQSITITISEVSEYSLGALIALFERAVGLYASLINVNAYDQPGVEAGKKAAGRILRLQGQVMDYLRKHGPWQTVDRIAEALQEEHEAVFKILRHLAANQRVKVKEAASVFNDEYGAI